MSYLPVKACVACDGTGEVSFISPSTGDWDRDVCDRCYNGQNVVQSIFGELGMGIDARGWFDIEGTKIGAQQVDDLNARFHNAGYDIPERKYFVLAEGRVMIDFDLARYYGPGYERGPFHTQLVVLGWLLRHLPPGGRVYFGGDSTDDDDLGQWSHEKEATYLNHYLLVGHEPYRGPRKKWGEPR